MRGGSLAALMLGVLPAVHVAGSRAIARNVGPRGGRGASPWKYVMHVMRDGSVDAWRAA